VTVPWPPAPAKPPISGVDLTISIISLVLTLLLGGSAAVMGFFLLAFLDYCPPETCSADGAVTAVGLSVIVAVVVGLVGLVVTIVQLVRRSPAWPFAVGTLLLCGVICAFGFAGYFAAVGAGRA
jgi:NO-binding membrane sensor protein with MHYT domain